MYLPYDTGFGFAHCICGGENSVGGSAHKKRRSTTDKIYQVEHPAGDGGKERIR